MPVVIKHVQWHRKASVLKRPTWQRTKQQWINAAPIGPRVGSDESHFSRLWEGCRHLEILLYTKWQDSNGKKHVQTKSGESLKIWFYGKDSKFFFQKHLQHLIYAIDDMLTNVGIKMEITKI